MTLTLTGTMIWTMTITLTMNMKRTWTLTMKMTAFSSSTPQYIKLVSS